jgi:hypothetical protein
MSELTDIECRPDGSISVQGLIDRVIAAEAQRDRLREALRWYEIRARLMVKPSVSGNSAVYELENDAGKKARAALQEGSDD